MARHPKQKREQKAPSQTLHNFFNSKPLRLSQTIKGKSTLPVRGQEIIVIDSDSEDEQSSVLACSSKRRKLDLNNSESPTIPNVKEPERLSPVRLQSKENPATIVHQASSSKSVQSSLCADAAYPEDSPCFGQPFLLVNDSLDTSIQEPVPSSFGKAFLLTSSKDMSDLSESNNPPIGLRVSSPTCFPVLQKEPEVDIDLTLDDWEDDDDERPPESKLDDEGDGSDIEFVSFEDMDTTKAANANAQPFGVGTSGNVSLSN